MHIREFLAIEKVQRADGDLEQEINGLTYDSRQARPGRLFFAVAGEKVDGHDYIDEAVGRGAAAVVFSRQELSPKAPAAIQVKNVRRTMALWAAEFFGRPSERLTLVGVTGTNGKTTLSYLVESILNAAGLEPGVIGTVNYRYRGREFPSHHTTPEAIDLQQMLADMVRSGVRSVAIEASSHALAQERVRALAFDVGVFTNLSRDHLDYHHDMEDYFSAKSRLFTDYLSASPKPHKAAVIFGEDPRAQELFGMLRGTNIDVWSYGEGAAWDVRPLRVERDVNGLRGTVQARTNIVDFNSSLVGAANLQNILGAIGVVSALKLDPRAIAEGIGQLRSVPGRLERVPNRLGITILVDYAHSPDALEKVLGAVRPLTGGKLVTVFGCGGDRDRGKRPVMGEIAGHLSDVTVLTSDNPRTENPIAILEQIEAGILRTQAIKLDISTFKSRGAAGQKLLSESKRGYFVEANRRTAIGIALSIARPGDLVLIAGKGHEDYQILGTEKIHFDDREVARQEAEAGASA